jgi:hypothetical protein
LHSVKAELHETFDMKVASQGREGEDSHRQLVSPLELMLDAAVESERHCRAIAQRARDSADERARATPRPMQAALAVGDRSVSISPRRARAPAHLLARPPARGRARVEAGPLGRGSASEVSGWVRGCAVALGLLALLTAFRLPVSPTSPARLPTSEPGAMTTQAPRAPADVANGQAHQVDADRQSRSSMLRPSNARDGAAPRATLESELQRSGGSSAPAGSSEPSRPSLVPAAQRAQAGAGHVLADQRAHVVPVDDLFGVGGA